VSSFQTATSTAGKLLSSGTIDMELLIPPGMESRGPIHAAAVRGHLKIINLFFENAIRYEQRRTLLRTKDEHGRTALHLAAIHGLYILPLP
jgi:hypothetical protein